MVPGRQWVAAVVGEKDGCLPRLPLNQSVQIVVEEKKEKKRRKKVDGKSVNRVQNSKRAESSHHYFLPSSLLI